ncbi:unnamed protein product [Rotaria magnacalcarata]|uniref:Uncharacterized protein n=2 Tax=Rotaria magnacalcarata TaxID=392030 RepID=A0A819TY54_9BILA|nr:unnamed protein product [Rotaria magnacalcarata]
MDLFGDFARQSTKLIEYINRIFVLSTRDDMMFLSAELVEPVKMHLDMIYRAIALRLMHCYMAVEFPSNEFKDTDFLRMLIEDETCPIIMMDLTNGSIDSRRREEDEPILYHADLHTLTVNLHNAFYAPPPSPPPSPPPNMLPEDAEEILNDFMPPPGPMVVIQDISGILAIGDQLNNDTFSTDDGGEVQNPIVEAPQLDDSVICLGGPYELGDTTYIDIGLNDAMYEGPDLEEAMNETVFFAAPFVSDDLPPDIDAPLLRPDASSTPKPQDLVIYIDLDPLEPMDVEVIDISDDVDEDDTIIFIAPYIAEDLPPDVEAPILRPASSSTPNPPDDL